MAALADLPPRTGARSRGAAVKAVALLPIAFASGCMYYNANVGAARASQTTTGDRWAASLYTGAGFRTTNAAPVRCGGGVGFMLTVNTYGDGYGVGPEARCNVAFRDVGYNRRLAVVARGMIGSGWLNEPATSETVARGRSVAGFLGVAYEMLSDRELAAGADHRPAAIDVALGLTASRLDLDGDHFSWIGIGVEGTLVGDLIYFLDQSGKPD